MPTSQPRTLTLVHSIVQSLQPSSMIDVGVGHGKTGLLAREYLDIMQCRYEPESWQTSIYGIEVFPDYHNPVWDYAYDEIVVCDALEGFQRLPDVDLVTALDIWEHFETSYAQQVLDESLAKAKFLLLSTPKSPRAQGDVLENAAERHVSKWHPNDFSHVPHRMVANTLQDWIIVLSATSSIPHNVRRFGSLRRTLVEGGRTAVELLKLRLHR